MRTARLGESVGQATSELLAAVPAVMLAGLLALQLLAAGYTLSLADGAVEAAAAALAAGRDPEAAARAAVPGWERERVDVVRHGSAVEVTLRPPAPVAFLADALAVSQRAWVRSPAGA